MAARPDLVLLANRFPFEGTESIIATELSVTASLFGRVYVVPSAYRRATSDLPSNVTVVDLGWGEGWTVRDKRRVLKSKAAGAVLAYTARRPDDWRAYLGNARSYLDLLAINLLKAERLSRWLSEAALENALFYDFWFENSTLAIALLRRQGAIECGLSRAHGFDIFDWRWEELGRVPFRGFKTEHLDAVFAVSEDGAGYLRSKLPGRLRDRVHVARLGVPVGRPRTAAPPDPPLIVSCSALRPGKQVHLIPEVLTARGGPLRWVHFGAGSDRPRVEAAARQLPPDIHWELRGSIANDVVKAFYRDYGASMLISMSNSEGVPISMMEAQSYGIPVVALAVGGVPEIVCETTGLTLPAGSSVAQMACAVDEALRPGHFDRERIRDRFTSRYEARTNYQRFGEDIVMLWERRTGRR